MMKVKDFENNFQEIRLTFENFRNEIESKFEDFKKEMNILSYESFNLYLKENGINQGFVDAKGSLSLNINQYNNVNSITNIANTISRLDKKV